MSLCSNDADVFNCIRKAIASVIEESCAEVSINVTGKEVAVDTSLKSFEWLTETVFMRTNRSMPTNPGYLLCITRSIDVCNRTWSVIDESRFRRAEKKVFCENACFRLFKRKNCSWIY